MVDKKNKGKDIKNQEFVYFWEDDNTVKNKINKKNKTDIINKENEISSKNNDIFNRVNINNISMDIINKRLKQQTL